MSRRVANVKDSGHLDFVVTIGVGLVHHPHQLNSSRRMRIH